MDHSSPIDPAALIATLTDLDINPVLVPRDIDKAAAESQTALTATAAAMGINAVITDHLRAAQRQVAAHSARRDELIALAINAAGMSPRSVAQATGLHHNTVVSRAEDMGNQEAVHMAKLFEAEALRSNPDRLPQLVLPAAPSAETTAWKDYRLPLGLASRAKEVSWTPARDTHLLITGPTGSGKSALAHHIIQTLTASGVEVWALDAALHEFTGYRRWNNIGALPETTEAMFRLLSHAHELLVQRYEALRTGDCSPEDFTPIVIVQEQLPSLAATAAEPFAFSDLVANLLGLGRVVRIHLVITMTRRGPHDLPAGALDNFGQQITMGRSTGPVGRGQGLLGANPTTFQACWGLPPDTDTTNLPHPAPRPRPQQPTTAPRISVTPHTAQHPTWQEITTAELRQTAETPSAPPAYRRPAPLTEHESHA